MKIKDVNNEIARLAFPAILSNITVPLMGLCDTAISGHLGSHLFLAAIASGSVMLNVIFWLCGFLRMGTTGLTAEAFGARDMERSRILFTRAFMVATAIGVSVLALSPWLCDFLLMLIGPEAEVRELARRYYMICIFGAPAQLATMAVSGWMVGMQNTVRPMIVAIASNVVNIIGSLMAVFLLKTGFQGIAYGTLVANWFGLALALVLARRLAGGALFIPLGRALRGGGLGRFFKVNSDLFMRSACVMAVTLTVTAVGARLGAVTLAANAVIMQFFIFFSYFMDGFAFCGEALCGKAMGAADRRAFSTSVRALLMWGGGMLVAATLIYSVAWRQIVGLLTDDVSVRNAAAMMAPWIIAIPAVSVATFILDGVYIGLTETRRMLWATASAMAVFMIVAFCMTGHPALPDNRMLWTAFLSYLLVRGVILILALPSSRRRRFPRSTL